MAQKSAAYILIIGGVTMSEAQEVVKADLVNIIKLGIQASGYVDLTDEEIKEVLECQK